METKFTLNELAGKGQILKNKSKDLEHIIDMIMIECSDYNPILMFLMGLNYHAFQEESLPEALLEVASRIQSKIELLGTKSPEAGNMFRRLFTQINSNSIFDLPRCIPNPKILQRDSSCRENNEEDKYDSSYDNKRSFNFQFSYSGKTINLDMDK